MHLPADSSPDSSPDPIVFSIRLFHPEELYNIFFGYTKAQLKQRYYAQTLRAVRKSYGHIFCNGDHEAFMQMLASQEVSVWTQLLGPGVTTDMLQAIATQTLQQHRSWRN